MVCLASRRRACCPACGHPGGAVAAPGAEAGRGARAGWRRARAPVGSGHRPRRAGRSDHRASQQVAALFGETLPDPDAARGWSSSPCLRAWGVAAAAMRSAARAPAERAQVLDLLHGPRFADRAPGQVDATRLDEGTSYCSERTMYRRSRRRRRDRRAPGAAAASALRRAGMVGDRTAAVVELGYHQAAWPRARPALRALCGARCLQSVRRRRARGRARARATGGAAAGALPEDATDRATAAHDPRRSRRADARPTGRVPARRSRGHAQSLAPAGVA